MSNQLKNLRTDAPGQRLLLLVSQSLSYELLGYWRPFLTDHVEGKGHPRIGQRARVLPALKSFRVHGHPFIH
jgi:hypothetical protein